MKFNLKKKCENSKKKEFYYGAKLNKQVKDVYLGVGFLEPGEAKRKVKPGRGHEEILYVTKGKLEIEFQNQSYNLEEGELLFFPSKSKAFLYNKTDSRTYFVIAGGHTKAHKH